MKPKTTMPQPFDREWDWFMDPLAPLKWRKPCRVRVTPDLFGTEIEGVAPSESAVDHTWAVMALCPHLTFQVLTKRSQRMREYLDNQDREMEISVALGNMLDGGWIWKEGKRFRKKIEREISRFMGQPFEDDDDDPVEAQTEQPLETRWPLPNVWLGVSPCDQATADALIPDLLATPAAVRYISAEPLLGAMDVRPWLGLECQHEGATTEPDTNATICRECEDTALLDLVICGGESGRGARPMHPDWARSLRDQCVAAGVAFFFKQWGEYVECSFMERGSLLVLPGTGMNERTYMLRIGKKRAGRVLDGRTWDQMPGVGG